MSYEENRLKDVAKLYYLNIASKFLVFVRTIDNFHPSPFIPHTFLT